MTPGAAAPLGPGGSGRPGQRPASHPTTPVHLTPAQARYLSILAAEDLRADEQNGRTPDTSSVIRDIHDPAWQALQPACHWDDQISDLLRASRPPPSPPDQPGAPRP